MRLQTLSLNTDSTQALNLQPLNLCLIYPKENVYMMLYLALENDYL